MLDLYQVGIKFRIFLLYKSHRRTIIYHVRRVDLQVINIWERHWSWRKEDDHPQEMINRCDDPQGITTSGDDIDLDELRKSITDFCAVVDGLSRRMDKHSWGRWGGITLSMGRLRQGNCLFIVVIRWNFWGRSGLSMFVVFSSMSTSKCRWTILPIPIWASERPIWRSSEICRRRSSAARISTKISEAKNFIKLSELQKWKAWDRWVQNKEGYPDI